MYVYSDCVLKICMGIGRNQTIHRAKKSNCVISWSSNCHTNLQQTITLSFSLSRFQVLDSLT